MNLAQALSRTTRLINQEIFDGNADEEAIAAGLATTTIRLAADEANMSSHAGQAALITAVQLIARMGIQVELDTPEVDLITDLPPLRRDTLQAALLDLGKDLLPGVNIRTGRRKHTDLTFCFGDTPTSGNNVVYVTASHLGCRLTQDRTQATRLASDVAIGALAAGAATAAIALEAAIPNIEQATKVACTRRARPSPGPPVELNLTQLFPQINPRLEHTGAIDVISGGAVANTFFATQLWLSHNQTAIRVLDDDLVELDNLNRCVQFRSSDAAQHQAKADALALSSTPSLCITGIRERFTEANRRQILPFAEHVIVGVDDIPARWRIQEAQPNNLYIGSTTNNEAILTTHHPGQPCAGCAHPDNAELENGQFIPTISFVSFWAGLLQTCALLQEVAHPLPARRITVYPFALGEPSWSNATNLPAGARCPLQCQASQSR
jgi:hypothetical protein